MKFKLMQLNSSCLLVAMDMVLLNIQSPEKNPRNTQYYVTFFIHTGAINKYIEVLNSKSMTW